MRPRDHQAILDSAFSKLEVAGVSLDHRRRWDGTGLSGVEKVEVILNDLFCEATRGGFDYWLQRRYCARGHVELQRVAAAIVEEHRAIDEVAAELVLAMCEAVELSPPALDPSYAEDHDLEADHDAYGRVVSAYQFADACYVRMADRLLALNQRIVEAWRDEVDPFELPLARQPARARRAIPLVAQSAGPVAFSSVALGVTKGVTGCELTVESASPIDIFNTAGLALFLAGAPLPTITALVSACTAVRDDLRAVLAHCGAVVDLDGTLRRTGAVADPGTLTTQIEADHAVPLGPRGVAIGGGPELAALMQRPHGLVAVIGGSPTDRRAVIRGLADHLVKRNVIAVLAIGEAELDGQRTLLVEPSEIPHGIRAALRGDPDALLIAPMPPEAAALAINGALTGHLVVCELAAGAPVEALRRQDLDPFVIASALVGVLHVAEEGPWVARVTTVTDAQREAIGRGEPVVL